MVFVRPIEYVGISSVGPSALQATDLMCSSDGLNGSQQLLGSKSGPDDMSRFHLSVVIRHKRYLRDSGESVVTRLGCTCARLSTSLHTITTDSCHSGGWTCCVQ